MQHADRRHLWPWAFLSSLQLLGRATACLPFGVPDPVLGETAAMVLYTGGCGSVTEIVVHAADAASLNAELMALGFRWGEHPTCTTGRLWHPQLEQGISVIEDPEAPTPAEHTNVVTISLDGDGEYRAAMPMPRLRMIGIEDLIAGHVLRWLGEGATYGEASTTIQMLLGLGWAGVSGRFRAAYLRRRLAHETCGEVALDLPPGYAEADTLEARTTSLSEIAGVIRTWRIRHGLAFDAMPSATRARFRHGRPRANPRPGERLERQGQSTLAPSNVIPFGWPPVGTPRMR